MSWLIGGGN